MGFLNDIIKKATTVIQSGRTKLKDDSSTLGIIKNTVTGIPQVVRDVYNGKDLQRDDRSVAENTILGLPKATKDMFASTRGYTQEELDNTQSSVKDKALAIPKVATEIVTGIGDLTAMIPGASNLGGKIADTKLGSIIAKGGEKIIEFGKPKTAGEAKAMQIVDVGSNFIPGVGSIKSTKAGLQSLQTVRKDLQVIDTTRTIGKDKVWSVNADAIVHDEAIDPRTVAKYKEEIQAGKSEPVRVRVEDGNIIPEDRDLFAAHKELGMENVDVIDVTPPVRKGGAMDIPKGIERAYSKRASKMMPDAEDIGSTYATRRSTNELSQKAKNLIKEDPVTTELLMDQLKNGGVGTKIDETHIAVASELLNDISRRADEATDVLTKNKLYDEAAELANKTAERLTQMGRDVQAASILSRMSPEGQVRFAAREIQKYNLQNPTNKIPELSGTDAKHVADKMREIQKMPEGTARNEKFYELQQFIQKKIPTNNIGAKIANVWKAGLLTGVKTSGLNVASNTAHFLMEGIKDAPAVIVDKAVSLFTGNRTKTLTYRKAFDGMKDGAVRGKRYFFTGFDERNIGEKLDYTRVNYGDGAVGKAFQAYTDTVFRLIGAQDQPYYYATLSRSMMDQALAAGMNKGLKGKELVADAYKTVENPTEEMLRYATLDAATVVFQNKTKLGAAAKSVQNIPGIGQFIVPFAQTPSAVIMQVLNYSPVGIVKTIIENIGKGRFDQRLFSQGLGRGIVGTAPLVIGASLYENGLISLDYPEGNERMIELNKAEGQTYNAVKIGDEWRSVASLGPAGQLLLIGAYFQKAIKETGSPSEAAMIAATGALASLSEQTFLTGAKNFMDAVSDPMQYGKNYLPNLAASFIPTLVSDTARATDGMERNTNGVGFIESFGTKAMARTPGLRDNLEPQVSTLGQELSLGGNAVETMLDPTRPSEIRSTPVTEELRRLQDAGYRVAPTKIGNKSGYASLSPEQETQLYKTVGLLVNDKLTKLFEHQGYQKLSDDEKEEKISQFVDKAKVIGRAQYVVLMTEGMAKEDRVELLKKYKADGLLTEQVFTEYKKLISAN